MGHASGPGGLRAPARALVVGALVLAAASPLAAAAATRAPSHLVAQRALALPAGAQLVKPVPSRTRLSIDLLLRVPSFAAVDAYVSAINDPSSPLFHEFLTPAEFRDRFGPSAATIAAAESFLTSAGLSVDRVSADGLEVRATGTEGEVADAFRTREVSYRVAGRARYYSNTATPWLPSSIATDVEGVLGLSDVKAAFSQLVPRSARSRGVLNRNEYPRLQPSQFGPQSCSAALAIAGREDGNTAGMLASYYAMTPLYGVGDEGQGTSIGLVELEPNDQSDIQTFDSCYGIDPTINYWPVDGGAGIGAGSGEAALDIENIVGVAPRATVDVYQSPDSAADFYDDVSTIANGPDGTGPIDQVASVSWGTCESYMEQELPGLIDGLRGLFAQMATQGQTMFAASGDHGSEDCGPPFMDQLAVDAPASEPDVIAVGGTTMQGTTEAVWNNYIGASGGGTSSMWCMPAYQDVPSIEGLIGGYSVADKAQCGTQVPYRREVPDVAALADPKTGYVIFLHDHWYVVGGTSAGAPLWAAVTALVDASPFCTAYGSRTTATTAVTPTGLYQMMRNPKWLHDSFYDVTKGNNDFSETHGDEFPAVTGYDESTGLGTPIVVGETARFVASMYVPGLAAAMCRYYATRDTSPAITEVSPDLTGAGRRTVVTIAGAGFLPIAGADRLEIGDLAVSASCSTTTRCTATLPAMPPGVETLHMDVEEFATSPPSLGSRFSVLAAAPGPATRQVARRT